MADSARARRLADRIKVLVAELLERRIKDPRLGFITVTDARMTADLSHATLFYTVFGDAEEEASTAAALHSSLGRIRSEVGKQLGIKVTPTLEFVRDGVQENVSVIDDLLKTAKERDAELAALAAHATPAGDADPYRKPRLIDHDDDHEAVDHNDIDDSGDVADTDDAPTPSVRETPAGRE